MLTVLYVTIGVILCFVGAIANRRWDAFIRAREDYDEDVDGKMTKKEKEAFEARKEAEAKLTRMPVKDVIKERPGRLVAFLILGAGCSLALALQYGVNAATWTLLPFTAILILISMIDLDTMEIPFSLNLTILAIGLISFLTFKDVAPFSDITIVSRLIGMVSVAGGMILIERLFYLLRGIEGAFGYGDVKLMAAAGFLLGWKMTLIGFFMGAIVGGVIGVVLLAGKKKGGREHVPFGPSLCAGLFLAVMFGTQLINWYADMLIPAEEYF